MVKSIATFGILLAAIVCAGASVAGPQQPSTAFHHSVSTQSVAAQAAFDEGLLDYYAYNVEAA